MHTFLNFLREQIRHIADIEATAHKLLHEAHDDPGYRKAMQKKAELLANLATEAMPYLDALPLEARPMLEHRLHMFAQSAQRSLDIGSVFYMSALLYPEDHQPGQPNTLEGWLKDLERTQNTTTL